MELPAAAATGQPQRACPRCNSQNTKFCYFNNYSLSQPRYLCKGCRRYWTHGGTLRNVPVGGSSRKSKRPRLHDADADASPLQPQGDSNLADYNNASVASRLPLPEMGPALGGGGFLSSLTGSQPMGFGWQQSFVGAGGDLGKASPPGMSSGALFWTLGGATSSGECDAAHRP